MISRVASIVSRRWGAGFPEVPECPVSLRRFTPAPSPSRKRPPAISSMSSALTARMKALRVKAQAMPVPIFTFSVLAASQVAWVTELRKSSGVQTQSMPAASADPACSARSAGVSPIAAIEMRSSAAKSATRALVQPEGDRLLVRLLEQGVVIDLGRIGLELVDVSLDRGDQLVDLILLARRGTERLHAV